MSEFICDEELIIVGIYMRQGAIVMTGGIIGFIIWISVSLVFVIIGFSAWRSRTPVGFFTFAKPPEVTDVKRYNHAVAVIWYVFAGCMCLLGLPLLAGQNSPYVVISIIGTMWLCIGIAIAYCRVEKRYRKKERE